MSLTVSRHQHIHPSQAAFLNEPQLGPNLAQLGPNWGPTGIQLGPIWNAAWVGPSGRCCPLLTPIWIRL